MSRLRFRYSKLGKVRFTSHRDMARAWERALRRAEVALQYTQGFSPRPKLAFGLALPTGCESLAEYVDVWVDETRSSAGLSGSIQDVASNIGSMLPEGVDVMNCLTVDEEVTSLQEEISFCSWVVEVSSVSTRQLSEAVAGSLAASALEVKRERKGRLVTDDIRPQILNLSVENSGDYSLLHADLGTRPRGVRPAELAQALGSTLTGLTLGRARRTNQWIERDGSLAEHLPMPELITAAASAPGRVL